MIHLENKSLPTTTRSRSSLAAPLPRPYINLISILKSRKGQRRGREMEGSEGREKREKERTIPVAGSFHCHSPVRWIDGGSNG